MDKLSKNQKMILGGLAIVIVSVIGYYLMVSSTNTPTEFVQNSLPQKIEVEDTKKEIIVHVAGAVEEEGVVLLKEGDRIINAIEKAGGTKVDADLSKMNLAQILTDGQKIYIPAKGEIVEEDYIVGESFVPARNRNEQLSEWKS